MRFLTYLNKCPEKKANDLHWYISIYKDGSKNDKLLKSFFSEALGFHLNDKLIEKINPYGPMFVMGGKRSSIVEDLDDEKLNKLLSFEDKLKNVFVLSRYYDVLWIITKEKKYADLAIENYRKSVKKLSNYKDEHVERHLRDLLKRLFVIERLNKEYGKINEDIDRYLLKKKYKEIHWDAIIKNDIIKYLFNKLSHQTARLNLFNIALKCYRRQKRQGIYSEYTIELYENIVKMAISLKVVNINKIKNELIFLYIENADKNPNKLMGCEYYDKAIYLMNKLDYSFDKVNEVKIKRKKIVNEFNDSLNKKKVSTSVDNGKELYEQNLPIIKKLSESRKLLFLLKNYKSPEYKRVVKQSKKIAQSSVFYNIITRVDVIPNRKLIKIEGDFSDMLRSYHIHRGIMHNALFGPFINSFTIDSETEIVLNEILDNNLFVRKERKEVILKGVVAGLNKEFSSAIRVLIPELENGFIEYLENIDIIPTLVKQNYEVEINLNDILLEERKYEFRNYIVDIIGEDKLKDLELLLCEKRSFNFRNKLAHGRYSDNELNSFEGIYCFFLILSIFCLGCD